MFLLVNILLILLIIILWILISNAYKFKPKTFIAIVFVILTIISVIMLKFNF